MSSLIFAGAVALLAGIGGAVAQGQKNKEAREIYNKLTGDK